MFKAPEIVSQRRAQASRFELPEGSLITAPLDAFLTQSLSADEDLLNMMLKIGQVGSVAVAQQRSTNETLRSIQHDQYWGTFEPFGIRLIGLSTEETRLNRRLHESIRVIDDALIDADQVISENLRKYTMLTSMTEDIRRASLDDQQQWLTVKGNAISQ